MADSFDLVIIGAGPGGYVAALRAGQLGLSTALVEKDASVGGTCLNRGCIPSKILLHAAGLLDSVRAGSAFGISAADLSLDMAKLQKRKTITIRRLSKAIEMLLEDRGVERIGGHGQLAGRGQVAVTGADGERTLEAKNILLATGSRLRPLPGFEPDGEVVLSSDDALELKSVPESVIVLGGGAIGLEFASLLNAYGSRVTIVELMNEIAPLEDEDASATLRELLGKKGITIHTAARLSRLERGSGQVSAVMQTADEQTELKAARLLVAVGREPVTDGLGLAEVGLETEKGFLPVDEMQRTRVDGVRAIGDMTPGPQLAHAASAQGLVAVESMAGLDPAPFVADHVPRCIYSLPELAAVGLSEAEARRRGIEVRCATYDFAFNSKSMLSGAGKGIVKLVADAKSGQLLGLHAVGEHVTEIIGEGLLAVSKGLSAEDLADAVHAHPSLHEAVMEAAHLLIGKPVHFLGANRK